MVRGTTSRMTITLSGFEGTSFEVMLKRCVRDVKCNDHEGCGKLYRCSEVRIARVEDVKPWRLNDAIFEIDAQ